MILTSLFILWLLPQYADRPVPTLGVSAVRAKGSVVATVVYPFEMKDKVHVCVLMQAEDDPSYVPRWCWTPSAADIEDYVIPNWPPPGGQKWLVSAFLQYGGTTNKNGVTGDFQEVEAKWSEVD